MTGTSATKFAFTPVGGSPIVVAVGRLVIGGWTGRDRAAVARYVDTIVETGFARPSSLPCFYEVSPALLTGAASIEVLGEATSGEVEAVLIATEGEVFVGLGSDHTDRAMAPVSVAHAKQLCSKPIASEVWRLAEVADHWDELRLTSEIDDAAGGAVMYQQGTMAELMPLDELRDAARPSRNGGCVLFCGTMPAIGGIRSSGTFSMRLEDPRTGRHIAHRYTVNPIPTVN